MEEGRGVGVTVWTSHWPTRIIILGDMPENFFLAVGHGQRGKMVKVILIGGHYVESKSERFE